MIYKFKLLIKDYDCCLVFNIKSAYYFLAYYLTFMYYNY